LSSTILDLSKGKEGGGGDGEEDGDGNGDGDGDLEDEEDNTVGEVARTDGNEEEGAEEEYLSTKER
jgi:hypothetical protein